MANIKPLSKYDFPDQEFVPDGYGMKEIPKLTQENFQVLIDKVNELINAYSAGKVESKNSAHCYCAPAD